MKMIVTYLIFLLAICYSNSASLNNEIGKANGSNLEGKFVTMRVADKQFLISLDNQTYYQALQSCKNEGLKLVSIQNEEDNASLTIAILEHLGNLRGVFWTSGTRLSDGGFAWLVVGEFVNYTYWGEGEPDNDGGKQNCITFRKFEQTKVDWDDDSCGTAFRYICEQ